MSGGGLSVLADAQRVIDFDPGAVALAFPRARSEHTRRAYAQDLRHFLTFVSTMSGGQVVALDLTELRRLIIAWREWMTDSEAAPRTVNRRLACLRSYFRELVLRGQLAYNPAGGIEGVRVRGDAELVSLSHEEASALVNVCRADESPAGLRDLALISLATRTGLRSSELLSADHASLAREGEWWAFHFKTKGGDARRTKVPADVMQRIAAWQGALEYLQQAGTLPPDAPLWRGLHGPRRHQRADPSRWRLRGDGLTKGGLDWMLASRCRQAGIIKTVRGKVVAVTPHVLRRTFCTLTCDAGCAMDRIQYAMGHADLRTTQAYYTNRDAFGDHAVDYIRGL